MKLGPVTKSNERKKNNITKIGDDFISANYDEVLIFLFYDQPAAIGKHSLVKSHFHL